MRYGDTSINNKDNKIIKMADNMTISVQAHCKILLHAAKYPHCAVNGILLAEDNKGKENKIIKYVDCIPLFHVNLGLSPMLEISLLQVCRSSVLFLFQFLSQSATQKLRRCCPYSYPRT